MASQGSAISSLIYLGTSIIPDRSKEYHPEKYKVLERGIDFDVLKSPAQVNEEHAGNRKLFKEGVKHQIRQSGTYSLSPFSTNYNQQSQIYSVVKTFKELSNTVNLSSVRLDAIADDPGLAQIIKYFGSTNLPTAVEGISNRIRSFLQKSISEEELYKGIAYVLETDFSKIKMYMIYTGLEREEDFEEWERFLKYVQELKRRYDRPKLPITVSFTPLFSTLGTPTQYHGSMVSKSFKQSVPPIVKIKKISSKYDIGVRMSTSTEASDFGQLMDFLDRRGQPLIEYGSLCSYNPFPKINILIFKPSDVTEITKEQYLETEVLS